MHDLEIERLIAKGEALTTEKKYPESVRTYLDALQLAKKSRIAGEADDEWMKKIIWMTCNGMGVAYAQFGHSEDAIDNFADAVLHAPSDEARSMSTRNLEKYLAALKEKTGKEYALHFILERRARNVEEN